MFQRDFITRTTPATRMTAESARKLLEQAVASARAVEAHIVLLRPNSGPSIRRTTAGRGPSSRRSSSMPIVRRSGCLVSVAQ
jgi:hypothetical protein